VGLVGLGWETPPTAWGMSVGAEALAGAAGGGGIDTQGGAITQPMLFVAQNLSEGQRLRLGAGRVASRKGQLDSTVFDVSLSFAFGLPRR